LILEGVFGLDEAFNFPQEFLLSRTSCLFEFFTSFGDFLLHNFDSVALNGLNLCIEFEGLKFIDVLDDSISFLFVFILFVSVFLQSLLESLDLLLVAPDLFLEDLPLLPLVVEMALQFLALRGEQLDFLVSHLELLAEVLVFLC
jgi:hypothetical protein